MRSKLIALLLCISVVGTMNPAYVSAEENVNELSDAPVIETVIEEEIEAIETDIDGQTDLDIVDEVVEEEEPEVAGVLDSTITTKEQLLALMTALNDPADSAKNTDYTLGADIDMGGAVWEMPTNSPISFDGGEHTIKNMTIKFPNEPEITSSCYGYGMFNKTKVSNLTFENVDIEYTKNSYDSKYRVFGSMVGVGSADNCHLKGNIKFKYNYNADKDYSLSAGGIIGAVYNEDGNDNEDGYVKDCTVDATVDFSDFKSGSCGGIAGIALFKEIGGTISVDGCSTTRNATIKGIERVAGIAGMNYAQGYESTKVPNHRKINIINCTNNAALEAKPMANAYVPQIKVAGITSAMASTDIEKTVVCIENCKNYRDFDFEGVDGSVYGIAEGANKVVDCVNYGNIKIGKENGGSAIGIVETVQFKGSISGCVNKGNITGNALAVGIANAVYSSNVSKCYNIGNITSSDSAAGIVFQYTLNRGTDSIVEKCFNTGNIVGGGAAGLIRSVTPREKPSGIDGEIPDNFSLAISDCFNCGIVCPYAGSTSFSTGLIESISYSAGGGGLSDNLSVSLERCYNIGAVGEPKDYTNPDTGNQIVRYLHTYYSGKNQKFKEADCYYLKDSIARPMTKTDNYSYMALCQIDEKGLSEAELKNAFSSYSTIWANGKTGYEFPYLLGVGDSDLPANYSHSRQLEEMKKLMQSAIVKDETAMYPDKNGRVINFTATTLDDDGNKVPVDLSDFIDFTKSDSNKDKMVLKPAKKMKILGYTFKGFYTTINGKEKKVTKLKLSTLDENVTLTAKYVVQQIKVGYKITKPDKGVKPIGKIKPVKYKFTESIALEGNDITAPGYKLLGWTTDKKNTTVADYKVGDNVAIADLLLKGKSVTLYTVWAAE